MEFCPKCGMRLTVVGVATRGTAAVTLRCPSCGYQKRTGSKRVAARVIEPERRESVIVIGKREASIKTSPTMKVECPRCGNMEAYVWLVQTRGADESSTQFFRCTKCGQTWREYS